MFGTIDVGLGDPHSAYQQRVQSAIEAYRREHNLSPGTKVVLAGHSEGGMVAQQLALNAGSTDYNVANVITFGSPQMGGHAPGTEYRQFEEQSDPVPLLSWYEDGPLVKRDGWSGALADLYAKYGNPSAESAFTGETVLTDSGSDPVNMHVYGYAASKVLSDPKNPISGLTFTISEWGPTEYYSVQ